MNCEVIYLGASGSTEEKLSKLQRELEQYHADDAVLVRRKFIVAKHDTSLFFVIGSSLHGLHPEITLHAERHLPKGFCVDGGGYIEFRHNTKTWTAVVSGHSSTFGIYSVDLLRHTHVISKTLGMLVKFQWHLDQFPGGQAFPGSDDN